MSSLFGKKKKKSNSSSSSSSSSSNNNDINKRKRQDGQHDGAGVGAGAGVGEKSQNDEMKKNKEEKEEEIEEPQFSSFCSFGDLGLNDSLVQTCHAMGFRKPTPVQRSIIPYLLNQNQKEHILVLAATGSGKTAAFGLPILQNLSEDPYGIYCTVITPTRELAKQIHQQILALGSHLNNKMLSSVLVIGGMDRTRQACALHHQRPHFCIATPGRLAELLRGPDPPQLGNLRYIVLDEADRLLAAQSGFEKDVAEVLLHVHHDGANATTAQAIRRRKRRTQCQTLLFSATMTRSLESLEQMAGAGMGRLPLRKFIIPQDGEQQDNTADAKKHKKKKQKLEDKGSENDDGNSDNDDEASSSSSGDKSDENETSTSLSPKIPASLKQEYVFMPSRVRDAYLVTAIRNLMANGGKRGDADTRMGGSGWNSTRGIDAENDDHFKCRSAIIFVSTCERAAMVSGILRELGVDNVALHSLLSQNRRLAALGKFQSQYVRILVATDVASRGLDIPSVDLVLNAELPRNATCYVHRVGRTARAGRKGRAISFVSEQDVALVHAAEHMSGRPLEKCEDITDVMAIKLLGPVTKAARLSKMKLMDIGFDELVKKMKERKIRDRKERERRERRLRKMGAAAAAATTAATAGNK